MIPLRPGDEDTICAISTAPGIGAIAVIRVSGAAALKNAALLAPFLPHAAAIESHRVFFGRLRHPQDGYDIDEVLIAYFANGKSFTGEETIEISCHGGEAVTSQILQLLVSCGCRLARPGEFSYRAFLNGRLDLVQAEGILGLIESRSVAGTRAALSQLRGELSRHLKDIEDGLVWMGAHIEAGIDFSSEGIELKPSSELRQRGLQLLGRVEGLLDSYRKGRLLKSGLSVTFIGLPNAGKSSLLNAVVEEDRAIVTDIPGTTRDVIEVETRFEGTPIRWFDTAGIRDTEDRIERLGVEKSLEARDRSDVVVVVIDVCADGWVDLLKENLADTRSARSGVGNTLFFLNKADALGTSDALVKIERAVRELGVSDRTVVGSARGGVGVAELKKRVAIPLKEAAGENSGVLTQARHFEGLEIVQAALKKTLDLMAADASPEILAYELRAAVVAIHDLLGKSFHEQVIDRVFREFCLGK